MNTLPLLLPHLSKGARPRPRRRRSVLAFAVALAVLALLALRLHGEHRFAPAPDPIEKLVPSTTTPLAASLRRLLGTTADARSSSAFVLLDEAHPALLTRMALIDLAEERLDLQYFTFEDDEVGNALIESLVAATRRGVEVRLLLDDVELPGREALLARLAADNGRFDVRVFNPTVLRSFRPLEYVARFPRATRRMHNESLSADAVAAVVGGRDIGNGYFDIETNKPFEDLDVLALGAVAGEVAAQFDAYWHGGLAVDVARLSGPADASAYREWEARRAEASEVHRGEVAERGDIAIRRFVAGTLEAHPDEGEILFDQPWKVVSALHDEGGHLAPRILELLASAEEELLLSSPYLIPDREIMRMFRDLRARGVRVTLLTNSLAANDVPLVHAGYRDYRHELLEIGIRLLEFKPTEGDPGRWSLFGSGRTTLHAKAFVVDGARSFVGSFNLDPRSAMHNTEMGVLIESESFAASLRERLGRELSSRAWEVVLGEEGTLEWHEPDERGNDVVHRREPGTRWWQRAGIYLASWLPIAWLL